MGDNIPTTSYRGGVATTKKTGKNTLPVFQIATLVAGTINISTKFINSKSTILFGRTNVNASTNLGELIALNITPGDKFTVSSLDNAGSVENGDLSTFKWLFLPEDQ